MVHMSGGALKAGAPPLFEEDAQGEKP